LLGAGDEGTRPAELAACGMNALLGVSAPPARLVAAVPGAVGSVMPLVRGCVLTMLASSS
jgi:hypothetical protein